MKRIGGIYDKLSRYEAETGVVIVYGSMYGNTEEMAEAIASRLAEKGIKTYAYITHPTPTSPTY